MKILDAGVILNIRENEQVTIKIDRKSFNIDNKAIQLRKANEHWILVRWDEPGKKKSW